MGQPDQEEGEDGGGGGAPWGEGFVSAPHARVDFVLGTTWDCGIGLLMTTWTRSRT